MAEPSESEVNVVKDVPHYVPHYISTAGSNQSSGCLAASANAQFRLDNLRPLAQACLGRWAVRFLVSAAALLCQMVRHDAGGAGRHPPLYCQGDLDGSYR